MNVCPLLDTHCQDVAAFSFKELTASFGKTREKAEIKSDCVKVLGQSYTMKAMRSDAIIHTKIPAFHPKLDALGSSPASAGYN